MARPSYKVPFKTLHERAGESLATTNHSIFNPDTLVVKGADGKLLPNDWVGDPITDCRLTAPTTVTHAWRAYFYSGTVPAKLNFNYRCYAFLPAELTLEEAQEVAKSLRDIINMKRKGA